MMKKECILVVNPGSTSTKAALFHGEQKVISRELLHSMEDLKKFSDMNEQLSFRKKAVLEFLRENHIRLRELSAIACRGGVVGELESGAYLVNQEFVDASLHSPAPHPANLSPVIGYEIAKEANRAAKENGENDASIKAYVYDPVCGCGIPEPVYTITGVPEVKKSFLTHVLNSRAVGMEQAKRDGVSFEDMTYIVAHLGGGITVNLLRDGRILDFVGDDEGGFSPERAGGLPVRPLVKLCYSGKYNEKEMQVRLKGKGGLTAYLNENDLRKVEERIDGGDKTAGLVWEAMVLQTAKDIASLAAVTFGRVDKIIFTGGMAYSQKFTEALKKRVEFVAPVSVIAGTCEMEALALGALRVLRGEEKAHIFTEIAG
ncbi:MAG: butyrate kinase [Dorea sp.]|jgi:butyrate kinase|nr:butyrate kinase [Dorea sp.]